MVNVIEKSGMVVNFSRSYFMKRNKEYVIRFYLDAIRFMMKNARLVEELNTNEYINCVIASGEPNFLQYCIDNNINYLDAIEYDWN